MAAAPDPDVALLLRVKARDPDALASLYARFARPLFGFLLRMTGNRRELAEDLLQETFLRAWRAAPAYEPIAAASTWLFTIARNAALNARSRARARAGEPAGPAADEPRAEDAAAAHAAAERAAEVCRAVEALPPAERDVVRLAVFERRRYADVARTLRIPEGTVKSRMAAATARLRGMLRRGEGA